MDSTTIAPALICISSLSPAGIVIWAEGFVGKEMIRSFVVPVFSTQTTFVTVGNCIVWAVPDAAPECTKGTPDT